MHCWQRPMPCASAAHSAQERTRNALDRAWTDEDAVHPAESLVDAEKITTAVLTVAEKRHENVTPDERRPTCSTQPRLGPS